MRFPAGREYRDCYSLGAEAAHQCLNVMPARRAEQYHPLTCGSGRLKCRPDSSRPLTQLREGQTFGIGTVVANKMILFFGLALGSEVEDVDKMLELGQRFR